MDWSGESLAVRPLWLKSVSFRDLRGTVVWSHRSILRSILQKRCKLPARLVECPPLRLGRLWVVGCWFEPRPGHTKDCKNGWSNGPLPSFLALSIKGCTSLSDLLVRHHCCQLLPQGNDGSMWRTHFESFWMWKSLGLRTVKHDGWVMMVLYRSWRRRTVTDFVGIIHGCQSSVVYCLAWLWNALNSSAVLTGRSRWSHSRVQIRPSFHSTGEFFFAAVRFAPALSGFDCAKLFKVPLDVI